MASEPRNLVDVSPVPEHGPDGGNGLSKHNLRELTAAAKRQEACRRGRSTPSPEPGLDSDSSATSSFRRMIRGIRPKEVEWNPAPLPPPEPSPILDPWETDIKRLETMSTTFDGISAYVYSKLDKLSQNQFEHLTKRQLDHLANSRTNPRSSSPDGQQVSGSGHPAATKSPTQKQGSSGIGTGAPDPPPKAPSPQKALPSITSEERRQVDEVWEEVLKSIAERDQRDQDFCNRFQSKQPPVDLPDSEQSDGARRGSKRPNVASSHRSTAWATSEEVQTPKAETDQGR